MSNGHYLTESDYQRLVDVVENESFDSDDEYLDKIANVVAELKHSDRRNRE